MVTPDHAIRRIHDDILVQPWWRHLSLCFTCTHPSGHSAELRIVPIHAGRRTLGAATVEISLVPDVHPPVGFCSEYSRTPPCWCSHRVVGNEDPGHGGVGKKWKKWHDPGLNFFIPDPPPSPPEARQQAGSRQPKYGRGCCTTRGCEESSRGKRSAGSDPGEHSKIAPSLHSVRNNGTSFIPISVTRATSAVFVRGSFCADETITARYKHMYDLQQ